MRPLQTVAVVLLTIAFLLTGFGRLLDMTCNNWEITRQHAWNDGIFIGVIAIAVLLWDVRR
jgi:hypothetical protein